MPSRLEEIFIITSNTDYLPFFTRHFGESGRDIAAVKLALGTAYTRTLDGETPEDNTIGSPWFQCGSNGQISNNKLKEFDKRLKLDLMAFQMKHHFVILSYYFEKYAAYEIQTQQELPGKIQASLDLFDAEFGSIGEGTLAVLHGWRPNSVIYNESFVTDYERVLDEVPKEIYELIEQEVITNPDPAIIDEFIKFGNPAYEEHLDYFNSNNHAGKQLASRLSLTAQNSPVYAVYKSFSISSNVRQSALYVAATNIMTSDVERTPQELSVSDRFRALSPMLEPDHLSDPDPFDISVDKIGFFDRTEFTLENLPDFSNPSVEDIRKMEDQAFAKVLEFYNKPLVWSMHEDLQNSDILTFEDDESEQAYLEDKENYRVTTSHTTREYEVELDGTIAFYKKNLKHLNLHVPIKFIEFRTPSLRPGDVYRAYFEISRRFIDRIETGLFKFDLQQAAAISASNQSAMDDLEAEVESTYCADSQLTGELAKIKFENYKAFAMKKKLEISREIRNKSILAAAARNEGLNLDLGVLGNLPVLNLLDDTSYETADILAQIGSAASNYVNRKLPPAPSSNPLSIHLSDLEQGITQLVDMFRSEQVNKDIEKFKIKNSVLKLDLNREAELLAPLPGLIKSLISANKDFRERVKNSSKSIEQILEAKREKLFSGSTGTRILIKFSEVNNSVEITEIFVDSSDPDVSKVKVFAIDGGYENLQGPLTNPRTLNYLKNIYNLIPLGIDNWQQALEQLVGLGSSPCEDSGSPITTGAGLIMRYTIHSDGAPMEFENDGSPYNPSHDFINDLKQREEIKRIGEIFDNDWVKEVSWGIDEALPEVGPVCTIDELYRDFIKKKNLSKLLCDFVSCANIPGVDIRLPNLKLPEIPDIPIFQYPGLDFAELFEQLDALALRMVCAIVKNLLDILNSPLCKEQLVRDLYGAASDTSPDIQRAFASAMVETGVSPDKNHNVSSLIDDLVNFLTPRELCALLQGQPVNRQVYNIIQNLAKNYDLEAELDSKEKILILFESIGIYIPENICSRLAQTDNLLGSQSCNDTVDLLTRIRNAVTRGEVEQSKIEEAVAQVEKNIMDKTKAFQLLTGELSLQDMIPEVDTTDISNSPALQESSKVALEASLSVVKRSYITSLTNFTPSLFLDVSSLVNIDSEEYDPIATMRFLRATNNLQKIATFNLTDVDFSRQGLTLYLRRTLFRLCDDYEKVKYRDFEVYRSQLSPVSRDELTQPDQAQETANDRRESALSPANDTDPYAGITTPLRGSLFYGEDLSNQLIESGITGLLGRDAISDPASLLNDSLRLEYAAIFDYLFPLFLEVPRDPENSAAGSKTEVVNTWPNLNPLTANRFLGSVGTAGAGNDGHGEDESNRALNISYLQAIKKVIDRYQRDIQETIEPVFRVVRDNKFLEVIRDFYNIELEAQREEREDEEDSDTDTIQLIKTSLITAGQSIVLEHPALGLMQTEMKDITLNSSTISNRTTIDDGFFLGTNEQPINEILLCEQVPEQYRSFFNQSTENNPLRRKVFQQQITDQAKKYYLDYFLNGMPEFENANNVENLESLHLAQYEEVLEGTIEQLVSYMGSSRLFEDAEFLQRLDSKLRSRPYFSSGDGTDGCTTVGLVNENGFLSQGPVKFDDLVTNFFPNMYAKELMDPRNSIYNLDYSKPGAFEKAIMSTILRGYIRVTCLEALIKGAIAYSTWDIDFVKSDPLFFEYLSRLVENSIENEQAFQRYPILLDESFLKIANTNNRAVAIRSIVRKELDSYVSILSKILFENKIDLDYNNWFLNQMKLVNAPYKRTEDQQWISELVESDINEYRKNSFTYLERYIRTNGSFELTLGPLPGLAERQKQALFDFIGYPEGQGIPYEHSFVFKLTQLEVPLELDVPTEEELLSFEIGEDNNIQETTAIIEDPDQWPEKELWSLEDFSSLLSGIYANNIGVERFVFHLMKKFYDVDGTQPYWHGKPKSVKERVPIRVIKRKRQYFRITEKDYFSARLAEDYDPVVKGEFLDNGDVMVPPQPRTKDSLRYHESIAGRRLFEEETRSNDTSGFPVPISEHIEYDDRHYILVTNPESSQDDGFKPHQVYAPRARYGAPIFGQFAAPSRGLSPSVAINDSVWESMPEESLDMDSIHILAGKNFDFVPEQIRDKNVFINKAGKITQEQYDNISDILGEEVEEEIWEEYIIDLRDFASPIFTQPGESRYIPYESFAVGHKQSLGNRLQEILQIIPNRGGSAAGLGPKYDEQRNIVIWDRCGTGESENPPPPQPSQVLRTTSNHDCENSGMPTVETAAPVRGIGFISKEDGLEGHQRDIPSSGYAYYSNDIGLIFEPGPATQRDDSREIDLGIYKLNEKSEHILGENEYKIPLRLLITQVKDSNGNIKECYVRYLIPEVATFGPGSDPSGNRDVYLKDATLDAMRGYMDFLRHSYNKLKNDDNLVAQTMRDWNNWHLTDPENTGEQDLNDANTWRHKAINWMMGRRTSSREGERGGIPVFLRSKRFFGAGRNSRGCAFLSIEKIWSQAANKEARENTGNFVIDNNPNEHSVFDEFFKYNPGNLLRREQPSPGQDGTQNLINPFMPRFRSTQPDGIATEEQQNILAQKYFSYSRASRHHFYEKSVPEILSSLTESRTSIGNLVSWYSQRRVDGFYGATSADVHGPFHKSGDYRGIAVNPQGRLEDNRSGFDDSVYRIEAADYDCGPSLFYGDNRNLPEFFISAAARALKDTGLPATLNNFTLNTMIRAYRNQNAYKVNVSTFRDPSTGGDLGVQNIGVSMNEDYVARLEKKKTLVALHSDPEASAEGLNELDRRLSHSRDNVFEPNNNASIAFNRNLTDDEQFDSIGNDFEVPVGADGGGFFSVKISQGQESGYNLSPILPDRPGMIVDGIFHNPKIDNIADPLYSVHNDVNLRDTSPARFYASDDSIQNEIDNMSMFLQETENFNDSISRDYLETIIESYSENHNQILTTYAGRLIEELSKLLSGIDPRSAELVSQLDARHGIRLNLVLDHDLETSENSILSPARFIEKLFSEDTEIAEEERTGRVFYEKSSSEDEDEISYEKYISIPMASYEMQIKTSDICIPNAITTFEDIKNTIIARDPIMLEGLSKEQKFKSFYEFAIPYRRLASLLTVHSTSMLAGYSTMPSVLTSTKSSLASVFLVMAQRDNFEATMSNQFGQNFNNADIISALGDQFPAGGEPPDCFNLDGLNGDWFKLIGEMIANFIKYFPSVIFRGVADQLDPAYKEMKSHFYACEIPRLNQSSLGFRGGSDPTPFGLRGDTPGQKSYIPVNTGFPIDLSIGLARMLNPFQTDGGVYLGKSINRLTSYIIGGPAQLLDSSYAFQIPCQDAESGKFRDWENAPWANIGQYGRYGHPLSLFTLLALPTYELPRDNEYRNQACTMDRLREEGIDPTAIVCSDEE